MSIRSITDQFSSRELLFLIIFGVAMVNIGFDTNLLKALSCGLYYFDYLVYFVLGYFLIKSLPELQKLQKSYVLLIGYVLITTYIFDWGYSAITHCSFSSVLFITTKSPFIASVTMILLTPTIEIENSSQHFVIFKKIANGSIKLSIQNICYAKVKHGAAQICLKDGTTIMVNESLKSIEGKLDRFSFYYKLNRQIIVNKNAISQVKSIARKGLTIHMLDGTVALVNKNNTSAFKRWFYS